VKRVSRLSVISLGLSLIPIAVSAQPTTPPQPKSEPQPKPAPQPTTEPQPAPPVPATDPDAKVTTYSDPAEEAPAEAEVDIYAKAEELATRVEELEAKLTSVEQSRIPRFPVKLTGYGDIGMFMTQGDGAGFRRDVGHTLFPNHSDIGWVFYGDLLATQINSRGDVADLGEAPGVERFDSVNSGGATSFISVTRSMSISCSSSGCPPTTARRRSSSVSSIR
jgi:hypothetical protein